MQGQLVEHPLAELIREIVASGLSGVLRLSQERAQAAVYFEQGKLVFATSNLRAHRLREVAKSNGLAKAQLENLPLKASDDEFASALLQSGQLQPEALAVIRGKQVSDVLKVALLWIDGSWEFDRRVRIAEDLRVQVGVKRLLLECARHLPASFVARRLENTNGAFFRGNCGDATGLLPAEASLLGRAGEPAPLGELARVGLHGKDETYRAIYALLLSGLLQCSEWPVVVGSAGDSASPLKATGVHRSSPATTETVKVDEAAAVEALFERLKMAKDHYEVLDIARLANRDEIKEAYHTLARRFHPDRFHQSASQLRSQVESAFAKIAHAYETLSDQSLRSGYDAMRSRKPAGASPEKAAAAAEKGANGAKRSSGSDANRAAASFQRGLDALQSNRHDEAIRFLADAAMLAPREARYRAHYGQALIRQSNTRRIAETELQAALALEPENASYRVMLAELYRQLGLYRRAEGELQRALAVDPKNEAARSLLASLKSKRQKS